MRLNAKQIAEYTAANVLVESMEPSRLATGIRGTRAPLNRETFILLCLESASMGMILLNRLFVRGQ